MKDREDSMARWWRHTLIAIAGLAAAFPLRVQLDFGHGSFLPNFDGSALAKGGDGGGNRGGTVTVAETGMAAVTGILMAVDAAVATVTPAAGTAAARLAAEETATATLTAGDVVAGLATVTGTETVVEMPAEVKAVEAATPAIRGMLVATGTATRVGMVTAMETAVVGTGMAKAVAKPTLTPGV
jgi:hypothetical protein